MTYVRVWDLYKKEIIPLIFVFVFVFFFSTGRENIWPWVLCAFGRRTSVLIGHRAEVSNCLYNFDCSLIASSSLDKSSKLWDCRMNSCLGTLLGHEDEVLDLTFDNKGKRLATASSDTTARLWDITGDFRETALMEGHREEVSKGKVHPWYQAGYGVSVPWNGNGDALDRRWESLLSF